MKHVIIACIAVCIAFGVAAGAFKYHADNLERALHSEKTAHSQTQKELENAISRSEALAENVRRCLAREAQAQADASERADILARAATRKRTAQEKEEVVDDATRNAVIDRLNRGLRY